MRVVIDWQISSFFGWGVYGLNLAVQWAANPSVEARARIPVDLRQLGIDALAGRALDPFLTRSRDPRPWPEGTIRLAALGNDLISATGSEAAAPVGICFFEKPLTAAALERAKRYELIVAGSSWNERLLREAGVEHVTTILQGVDRTLFRPGSKRDLFRDRFLIFSGGKAEPRKGQDLVVKAFRIFAERHPEAMLVTAWHSPWPQLAASMDLDLSDFADRVIDVGPQPNIVMPQVYRECDVALFPNRAEGGTNLVVMECLACGLWTILSANTGHLDLIDRACVLPLKAQAPSTTWPGGGESDLEEILWNLEAAFTRSVPAKFNPIGDLTWSATAAKLLETVEMIDGRKRAA